MNEIQLNNGIYIPLQGLGGAAIYGSRSDVNVARLMQDQYEIYKYAMEEKECKLFDTSGGYGYNEEILGQVLSETKRLRNSMFITSKISNRQQETLNVRSALECSLKNLKIDYLDLYLIHWPQPDTFVETWLQMEKLYLEGLVKAIGVCNFSKHHLEYLMKKTQICPMVNQFEIHPLFTQDALVNYCRAYDIQPMAYTPIGRMHDCLIKAKPIQVLADKYNCSPVKIILQWHKQQRYVAIPRTLNKDHFDDFFVIDDFQLTAKEVCWISSLNDNIRLRYNPDTVDFTRT